MRLLRYKGKSTLKKAGLNLLVQMIDQEDVRGLREQFEAIDKQKDGVIEIKELSKILRSKGLQTDEKEVKKIISELDYLGNGKINYSEFLAATIDVNKHMSEQKLKTIFQQFDTDDSGALTKSNLYYAMQKLGQEITDEEINDIMKEHDKTGNDQLGFDEFKIIFKRSNSRKFSDETNTYTPTPQ